jgi:hypothetical protein
MPVFACRVCRKPVYVTHLSTHLNDPDGKVLMGLMKAMRDIALCPECQRKRDWYANQNREEEFLKNELNPNSVLYNVVDNTGIGWYANGIREPDHGRDKS